MMPDQSEPPDSATIRILVADGEAIVRSALHLLLEKTPDLIVAGEAATGEEAIGRFRALQPDLFLLDLIMPDMSGEAVIRAIKEEHPQARILVLTRLSQPARVLSALRAGADGYLLKASTPDLLPHFAREACAGRPALDPALTATLVQQIQRPAGAESDPAERLTEREMEVLLLIARGLPNQDIADRLVISERTVRTHVGRILDKLDLANRTQAALFALRQGWASLDE